MAATETLVKTVAGLEPAILRAELLEAMERERVLRHLLRAAESSARVRRGREVVVTRPAKVAATEGQRA